MYSPIPAISKTADTIISANSTITSMTASNNVAATKTTMPKTRDVQRQHHEKEKQTQRSERQPLQQQIEERDDNNQNDIQNDYNNNSYRRRRSLSMIRQPNQPRERSSSRINHNKYVSRCQSESPMRGRSALSTKIYVNNTDCRDGEVNNKSTNTKYHHSKQQTRSCDRTNNQTTMNGGNASINSKYSSSNISLGTKNTTHSLNFLERILSKRRRGTRDIQSDNSILESREESNSSHVIGNTRKYSYGNNEAETRYYRTTMSTVAARSTDTVTTKEIGNNIETMLRPNGKNTTTNNAVHPIEMKARVLQNLIASKCTDVQYNDKDLYGDGDQSPVYEPDQQYLLHTLFYTGKLWDYLFLSASCRLNVLGLLLVLSALSGVVSVSLIGSGRNSIG